jgi:CheY-like chemotaxis protein
MNPTPSRLPSESESVELLGWDDEPTKPTALPPASGDAATLRSEIGEDPDRITERNPNDGKLPWDSLAPGSMIDGKYRVMRELGRGAMGIVVLAHDETLDRRVAVKLVQSALASPGFQVRFLEEARAMARVNHRNVVQIYASGEHEKIPYFVMELVAGNTVEEWMEAQTGAVEIGAAVRLLASVCEGVSAIHAADTLHRDIKPSNILLDGNLRPRIADLGVSTFYRSRRASRPEIVGTPAYMAPEIAFPMSDEQPTPRADVYSLGCVAYELLTGALPFAAKTGGEWVIKHATVPVPLPSSIRTDLPAEFDRVLLGALAKDPNDRTPTVEAFRRDLLIASGEGPEPVRILVAEDDKDFRELLGIGLEAAFPDAEVVCVPDGRAALEALQVHSASVAILDLNMPDLGGEAVTQSLRASETGRTMPIIVLTGSGGPAEWRHLLSLGADRFLVKPVSLDDLVTSVRHSLRERSRASEGPPGRAPADAPGVLAPASRLTSNEAAAKPRRPRAKSE